MIRAESLFQSEGSVAHRRSYSWGGEFARKTPVKAAAPAPNEMWQRELVLFRFRSATAKAVVIAGIAGDWHPSFVTMEKCSDGLWQKYLHMCPGEHSYRLIIDGVA